MTTQHTLGKQLEEVSTHYFKVVCRADFDKVIHEHGKYTKINRLFQLARCRFS